MASEFKSRRYGPRDINKAGTAWFYRNEGSVDVCDGKAMIRIPRKALENMLRGLKPLAEKKRAATKPRKRSERSRPLRAKR